MQLCDFIKGLKNEFKTAVVNEPSVFEPLKFYCILNLFTRFDYNIIGTANDINVFREILLGASASQTKEMAYLKKITRNVSVNTDGSRLGV